MHGHRSFLRACAALSLLSVTGCLCSGSASGSGSTSSEVEYVQIRPGLIHATPGSVFELEADVRGWKDKPLSVPASPNISIAWSSPHVSPKDASPTLVTVPEDPGTSFVIEGVVTDSNTGDVFDAKTTVVITPKRPASPTTDWIAVEHIADNPPVAVLVTSPTADGPVVDWSLAVVGEADLGRNFHASPPPADLALFAKDREMELRPGAEGGSSPWTASHDPVEADPMSSEEFRVLPVWNVLRKDSEKIGDTPAHEFRAATLAAAFGKLNRNRVGLELDALGHFEHSLGDEAVINPSATCADIDSYIAPHSITDPAAPSLFVLYVSGIFFVPTDTSSVFDERTGWACIPHPDWTGRVILMSEKAGFASTLAHEIGHVLSLSVGYVSGNGHVNGLPDPGFDHANLMWDSDQHQFSRPRNHLTLGQVYRMNAHPESWINHLLPTSEMFSRPCQISYEAGACPALVADLEVSSP